MFIFFGRSPPHLFGIPGDNFIIKINRPPPGDSTKKQCHPRGENISIPTKFHSAPLSHVRNEQYTSVVVACCSLLFVVTMYDRSMNSTLHLLKNPRFSRRYRTSNRAQLRRLYSKHLQLLAVLVRGASLRSDESPKVKQGLRVL